MLVIIQFEAYYSNILAVPMTSRIGTYRTQVIILQVVFYGCGTEVTVSIVSDNIPDERGFIPGRGKLFLV
jgi:hypothetical protein